MTKPSYADLVAVDVHAAKALLRGDDECRCRRCLRVTTWEREQAEVSRAAAR